MHKYFEPAAAGGRAIGKLRAAGLGQRPALVLFALVAVAALLSAVNSRLTATYTPANAVLGLLSAERAGDPGAVAANAGFAAGPLTGPAALTAMLANPANRDLGGARIRSVRRLSGDRYSISVAYSRNGKQRTEDLAVVPDPGPKHWLLYPAWRVLPAPAALRITEAAGGGRLRVDGIALGPVAAAAGTPVVPGWHWVGLDGTSVTEPQRRLVNLTGGLTSISLAPRVKAAESAQALSAVAAALAGCADSQDLKPAGCPNSTYHMGDRVTNVVWSVTGGPAPGAVAPGAAPGTVVVSGTWQMRVAYDYGYQGDDRGGHRVADEGGSYAATVRGGKLIDLAAAAGG